MELDNFILEKYQDNNIVHREVINKLFNDVDSRKYLGNLEYAISNIKRRKENDYFYNDFFIVFYNEEAIGFISLTHKKNVYEVSYGIVKERRGEYLGTLLLQEFSEKIFDTLDDVNEITLVIDCFNTGSKKTALLAGYDSVSLNKFIQKRR